ncbi:hypothetical protein SSX86_011729 [Deinandra increscens subsp. villosa]|uniref:Ribosome-recycling factor, chloroplastic n=1 Tax=Deinandra increscens subsp. villosa TaxID=3103831 RepID=A0AAP0GY35_9ASTR
MKKTIFVFSVLGFLIGIITLTAGESPTCLAVYKEGGAPAVFRSPQCPTWSSPKHHDDSRKRRFTCQSATRQGRRKSLEDRTFCTLDFRIPILGTNGIRDTSVGIVAVFDGHNGAEASEMASNLLLEYFTLHTSFLFDATYSFLSMMSKGMLPNKEGGQNYASQMPGWDEKLGDYVLQIGRIKFTLSKIFNGDFHLEILKESLLKAIDDIDATFCEEASRYNFNSGSTATVVLIADSQILAANVGDSKAFLCSEMFQSPPEAKATLLRLYSKGRRDGASKRLKDYGNFKLAASNGLPHFAAKELTKDHHPDRVDERSRVEASGGYVSGWGGVSRVNGGLAVSRAIGDLSFKSFGVISVPEVTDWQPLTANDSYLVATSDGVLEKLSPQDVCDLFWELHTNAPLELQYSPSCSYSLADCIVDTALERGSMDNVAAVVVPFGLENLPTKQSREEDENGGIAIFTVNFHWLFLLRSPLIHNNDQIKMAMHSLSPATSSVRSIHQRPRISTKLLNRPTTLVPFQGNLLSWSSSGSYVELKARISVVDKTLPQKRNAIIMCATLEEIEAEKTVIEKNAKERMEKAIDSMLSSFNSIRTGRSNPAMLDKIEVEYYGSPVNLKTIAQISTPDSSSLLVQPYDKSSLKAIEKAIVNSDLGMTPNNDGDMIRLSLPQLTSERRKELSKVVAKQAEEGKVAIRNIRRDAIKAYDKLEKEKKLSEDNVKDLSADLQKVTDEYMKKIETIFKQKEKELLTV